MVGAGSECHGRADEQKASSRRQASHATPPQPSAQLHTPGATQRPRWLQESGHDGTSQLAPSHPPKH